MREMIETLALYAAMEISALQVLLRDYTTDNAIFLAGSAAPKIKDLLEEHLSIPSIVLEQWSAAKGCATIAKDVWEGASDLLGILSLIHISEPTRLGMISYAVFCL